MMSFFDAVTLVGLCLATLSARVKAVSRALPVGVISSMSPIWSARSGLILSPQRMMRFAQPSPTIRVRFCVPPPPGRRPTAVSGSANAVCSSAILMSQASAHSSPPPMAYPLMAAIETPLKAERASKAWPKRLITLCALSLSPLLNILRSAPAEKNFSPSPVMTSA